MTKQGICLGLLLTVALAASTAQGATYVVKQDGSGDFTTVEEAFFATKGDGVDDIIEIQDSATYDIPLQADMPNVTGNTGGLAEMDLEDGDGNLTLQAAAGQTPTVQTAVDGHRIFRNRCLNDGLVLTVQGASDSERMVLRGNGPRPLLNFGPGDSNGTFVLANLVLDKPQDATGGNNFVQLNNPTTGTHSMTNISFTGGNPDDGGAIVQLGNAFGADVPTIICDNLDFSGCTLGNNSGGYAIHLWTGAQITISNSNIVAHADAVEPGRAITRWGDNGQGVAGMTIEFINCTFTSGGGSGFFRGFDGLGNNSLELNNYILTDPVFAGGMGDVAFAAEGSYANFTIRGTDPANKVDLSPMATDGTVLGVRTTGGTWTFENCTDSVGFPAGLIDCASGNPLVADVNVIQNQCEWLEGRSGDFIAVAAGGDFSTNFTATNVIWAGTTNQGHLIYTPGSHTGASNMTLDHCTVAKRTNNALFFGDAARGDTFTISNSIIYADQITASRLLSSIPVTLVDPETNITYANDSDDGNGEAYEGDAGLGGLAVDPLLDATGHLTADSPALDAAVGSTVAIDVDGESRPQPADTINDIGADESSLMPALTITRDSQANVNVQVGESATFMVDVAHAVGGYTVEWFFDDGTGAVAIPNSDTAILVVNDVSELDMGTYYCVVTDDIGSLESPAFTLGILAAMPVSGWPALLLLPLAAIFVLRRRQATAR